MRVGAIPDHAREALAAFAAGRELSGVRPMAGNAGFSYGFTVGGEQFVLRVPPPGVRHEGPADVLRQASLLTFLADTAVPVPAVRGIGTPERPWFVVDRVAGASIRPTEDEPFDPAATRELSFAAVDVLREIHAVRPPAWLGPAVTADASVRRWDRFRQPDEEAETGDIEGLRRRLLDLAPPRPRTGLVHGDYQWGNVLGAAGPGDERRIVAVIDWELTAVGSVLDDLGWLALFSDRAVWTAATLPVPDGVPSPEELAARYGVGMDELAWHRALAGYVFAVVAGLNLRLHRAGKRPDPLWERVAPARRALVSTSLELLG